MTTRDILGDDKYYMIVLNGMIIEEINNLTLRGINNYDKIRALLNRHEILTNPNVEQLNIVKNINDDVINNIIEILGIDLTNKIAKQITIDDINSMFDKCQLLSDMISSPSKPSKKLDRGKPKTVISFLNYHLSEINANIKPVYRNKTAEARCKPSYYELEWLAVDSY